LVSDFIVQISIPKSVYNKLSIGVSTCAVRPVPAEQQIDSTPSPITFEKSVLGNVPQTTVYPTAPAGVTMWRVPDTVWSRVRNGELAGLGLKCQSTNIEWCRIGVKNEQPITMWRRALLFDRQLNAATSPTCAMLMMFIGTGSNEFSYAALSPEKMSSGTTSYIQSCSDFGSKTTERSEFHVTCVTGENPDSAPTGTNWSVACPEQLWLSGDMVIKTALTVCNGRNNVWGGGTTCRKNYQATETALVTRRSPTVTAFPTKTAYVPPTVTRRSTPIPAAPAATQTAYANFIATATAFTRAVQTAAAATNQLVRTQEAATLTAIKTPTVAINSTQTRQAELAQTAIALITQTKTAADQRATRVTDAAAITGSDTSVIGIVTGAVGQSSVSTGLTEVTTTYTDVIDAFAVAAGQPNTCANLVPPMTLPQQNKFGINPYNTLTRFSNGLCLVRDWLFDWWFSAVIRTIISVLLILWLLYVVYLWIISRSK